MYVLDTDVSIYLMERRHPALLTRFESELSPSDMATTAITAAELRHGALKSLRVAQNLERLETFLVGLVVLPFDADASRFHAENRDRLRRRGTPIGTFDLLIAATALAHDATLVTNNTREFARIPGLKFENWLENL